VETADEEVEEWEGRQRIEAHGRVEAKQTGKGRVRIGNSGGWEYCDQLRGAWEDKERHFGLEAHRRPWRRRDSQRIEADAVVDLAQQLW
jgi:hypothetical protein